jgi:hypothetical protein
MMARIKYRVVGVLLLLILVGPLAAEALRPSADAPASTLNPNLWDATVAVESGGDPAAYNTTSGATGIAQIKAVCLADCNRIARLQGLDVQFAPADRWDAGKSRQMWELYLGYYGDKYVDETGESPTDEIYARMWKGGPTGWRKAATTGYWQRVQAAMP